VSQARNHQKQAASSACEATCSSETSGSPRTTRLYSPEDVLFIVATVENLSTCSLGPARGSTSPSPSSWLRIRSRTPACLGRFGRLSLQLSEAVCAALQLHAQCTPVALTSPESETAIRIPRPRITISCFVYMHVCMYALVSWHSGIT
jgi:hypothetical protein